MEIDGINAECVVMPKRSATHNRKRLHFIREWRKFRGLTQERLADRIPTSVANISRIESGKQDYTQSLLEAVAEALSTDAASLIMRDPSKPEAIWTIWENASEGQKVQITEIAKALLRSAS